MYILKYNVFVRSSSCSWRIFETFHHWNTSGFIVMQMQTFIIKISKLSCSETNVAEQCNNIIITSSHNFMKTTTFFNFLHFPFVWLKWNCATWNYQFCLKNPCFLSISLLIQSNFFRCSSNLCTHWLSFNLFVNKLNEAFHGVTYGIMIASPHLISNVRKLGLFMV